MYIALLILIGIFIVLSSSYQIAEIRALKNALHVLTPDKQVVIPSDSEELSPYEQERMERDRAFDERIMQIKEELARQQEAKQKGHDADELHPLVKNLPHNNLDNQREPQMEYAE